MTSILRRPARGLALLGAVAVVVLLAVPGVAGAQTASTASGDHVTLNGNVVIGEGETIDGSVVSLNGNVTIDGVVTEDVFLLNGNLIVNGRVDGHATNFNGNTTVSGVVGEDVHVLNGNAIVGETARVGGDVTASTRPIVAPGAAVEGEIDTVDLSTFWSVVGWGILAMLWLAVSLSTLVLGLVFVLVFPRAAEATVRAARSATGASIGIGVAVLVGLPIIALFAAATLLGAPLAVGLLGLMLLLLPLGYVAGALVFGRWAFKRLAPVWAFLATWAILRVAELVPVLGALAGLAATVVGLGALTIAAWRAGRSRPVAPELVGLQPGQPLPPPQVPMGV